MFKLMKMIPKRLKWFFLLGSFFILITVLINIFFPNLISQFIKLIIVDNRTETTDIIFFDGRIAFNDIPINDAKNYLIIAIVLSTLSNIAFVFLGTFIIIYAAENCSKFFRITLFEKIQKLSLKNIADLKSESIITRVSNDIAIFWEFLVNGTTILIKGMFLVIGTVILAIWTDLSLSIVIAIMIPSLLIMISIVGLSTKNLLRDTQKTVEFLTKNIDENINGIKVIKTYNLEKQRKVVFKENNQKWYQLQRKSSIIFMTAAPVFFMLINFLVLGIYGLIAKEFANPNATNLQEVIAQQSESLAKLNTFIDYLYNLSFGIMMMMFFLVSMFRAIVSAKRINEIYDYKIDDLYVADGLALNQNYDLHIKDLNFKYYQEAPELTLSNINLKLPFKHTLGIIGPTGSGKSTLANLIIHNYLYNDGSIKIGNQELKEINSKNLHDSVGIVYQKALLYSGTIRSNLLWAKEDATEQEIQEALENACAAEFVNKFEDGLDHPVAMGGSNLSGGQKQRLSIARALLRKPKILILDDSTSALDNLTTKKVIENIKQNYDCSTIIISQKIGALKNANNIVVMEQGRIVSQGKHEELINLSELYNSIYTKQLDQ